MTATCEYTYTNLNVVKDVYGYCMSNVNTFLWWGHAAAQVISARFGLSMPRRPWSAAHLCHGIKLHPLSAQLNMSIAAACTECFNLGCMQKESAYQAILFLVLMESKILSTTQQTMVVQSLWILTIHYCKNIWITSTVFLPSQLHACCVRHTFKLLAFLKFMMSS